MAGDDVGAALLQGELDGPQFEQLLFQLAIGAEGVDLRDCLRRPADGVDELGIGLPR